MDTTRIGQVVSSWIDEEDVPTGAYLKVDRTAPRYFRPTADMEDDEADAYWEFIQTTMNHDHQILLSVPAPEPEYDFWPIQLDDTRRGPSEGMAACSLPAIPCQLGGAKEIEHICVAGGGSLA